MTRPHRPAISTSPLVNPDKDKRLYKRVVLSLPGRVLDDTGTEHTITTLNISCSGAMIESPVRPGIGSEVICYFNDLARVTATVIRATPNGFATQFRVVGHKRDKLADRLTWLLNKDRLGLAEDRASDRQAASGPAVLTLNDGREIPCRVLDISLTGASFEAEQATPMVGDTVISGSVRGDVVRVTGKTFAIRYSR